MRFSSSIFILCFVYVSVCHNQFNPYEVLKVSKTAKSQEIRKAYRNLVKLWHPDKNKSPNAQDKFMEIQQAYEILSNEDKRNQYDTQGFTSDNQQWSRQAQNFKFDDFFAYGFHDFNFHDSSDSKARSISNHKFFKHVIPDSYTTPQVLYIYSTFCMRCIAILKSSWQQAAKDLENLGLGVGTVDTSFYSRISSYLRVRSVPTIVVIFEERYSYYYGLVSYENIKKFLSAELPSYYVQAIASRNIDSFLRGVDYDDKPRALLFSKQSQPTLLYTLMAIKYNKYIKFGFASLADADTKEMGRKYGVRGTGPTLLIFKEDTEYPAVTLQSSDMPRGAVNEILSLHRYMAVPRLTSQEVFDDVCPPPAQRSYSVNFCAIFASNDKGANHVTSLTNLRRVVTDTVEVDEQLSHWLKFFYVVDRKQEAFVKALGGMEELPREPAIYLIWRRDVGRAFSTTFSAKFLESDTALEYGFQKFLAACLQTSHQRQFEREVRIASLNDELAPFLLSRVVAKTWKMAVVFVQSLGEMREQELMLLGITLFVLFLSIYSAFVPKRTSRRRGATNVPPREMEEDSEDDVEVDVSYCDDDDFHISDQLIELKQSTYEELVLRQKRGHLTIVILVSWHDHKIDEFTTLVEKFKSDNRLSFAYLKMTSYLSWYKELRKTSSAQPPQSSASESRAGLSSLHSQNDFASANQDYNVHPVNAHGKVLAINGSKHWYCIYVPRVNRRGTTPVPKESVMTSSRHNVSGDAPNHDSKTNKKLLDNNGGNASFSNDSVNEYSLGLEHWLDRVCDGQLPRLYVRQWPGLYTRSPDSSDDEY